jgi:hypothetical protein
MAQTQTEKTHIIVDHVNDNVVVTITPGFEDNKHIVAFRNAVNKKSIGILSTTPIRVIQSSRPDKSIQIPIAVEERPIVIEEPQTYTKEQVKNMDSDEIIHNFVRITGQTTLKCTHCGKGENGRKPINDRWVNSILVRAKKIGIYPSMKVPKTCDIQQYNNHRSNPSNNPAYQVLYSKDTTVVTACIAVINRIISLKETKNISAKPYKHTSHAYLNMCKNE